MDFSKFYEKLPKRIQKSEKLLIYGMRFSQFIHSKTKKAKNEPNYLLNFLYKQTNIETKGTLRDIQLLYVELMRFIDNVCEKYNLEYCLAYGTLLGAIRHEGFIPWDDDFDIIMIRNDYNKLIDVLPKEIEKYDYFKENCALTRLIRSDENYFSDFNTIYDKQLGHYEHFKNTPILGFSIFLQLGWLKPMVKLDIFPYDYIKEESIDYYKKNYLGHKFYFRRLYDEENFSFTEEFNERFRKLGFTYKPTDYVAEGIDSSYIDNFPPIKKEMLFPTKKMKFEGYDLKCPNKPHEIIKIWYGDDYMDIPQNARVHGYSEYNLTLFDSKSQMELEFKKAINYLKEINENFKKEL